MREALNKILEIKSLLEKLYIKHEMLSIEENNLENEIMYIKIDDKTTLLEQLKIIKDEIEKTLEQIYISENQLTTLQNKVTHFFIKLKFSGSLSEEETQLIIESIENSSSKSLAYQKNI